MIVLLVPNFFIGLNLMIKKIKKIFFYRNTKSTMETKILSKTEDGVRYSLYKVSGIFQGNLDLKDFPFDKQHLSIGLEMIGSSENVRISFENNIIREDLKIEDINLSGWDIDDIYISIDESIDNIITYSLGELLNIKNKETEKRHSLNIHVDIERSPLKGFITLVLPLLMISLATILLLFVKNLSFNNIGEVIVVIFLSIVTHSIPFSQLTPSSNIATIAD